MKTKQKKPLSKLEIEGHFLSVISLTLCLIVKHWMFSQEWEQGKDMTLTTHIHYYTGSARQCNRQEKEIECRLQGINKNFIFTDNVCSVRKSLVNHQKKKKLH